jgi:hypothetical protein
MASARIALLTLAVVGLPTTAQAWGATGHRIIGALAVKMLPEEMPAFLRSEEAARQAGELSREPDRWRGSGETHDAERDPGHFVDVADDLSILGGPKLDALPSTRRDYDTALRAIGTNQYKAGYLPYSIIDGWQQVRTDFAYWRVDAAGEKHAKSEEARAWFARDRALHEMLAVRDLGVWSHFVGDGSQPMHVSVHYDGWGDYPNPEGFSTKHGVHLHFEGAFVHDNVTDNDVAAIVSAPRDCGCSIEARTAQYLNATAVEVVPFYRLEKTRAFARPTAEGKAFAAARIAAAVAELRDMTVAAWNESEDAKVGYPPISVRAAEAGTLDPLPSLKGED